MKAKKLNEKIWAFHADVIAEDLFEGIWPLPNGVTLNSYLVKGYKIALIDLVRDWAGAPDALERQFSQSGHLIENVDYLILNHLEPDHTGWLVEFRKFNRNAKIIATKKGVELIKSFYKIDTNVEAVKTGDRIDLGNNTVLEFIETPNVHWPETMFTYESSTKSLFPCDLFGGFGVIGESIFDDEIEEGKMKKLEEETLRYYTNVLSGFPDFVEKALDITDQINPSAIAPGHGVVWRKNVKEIINRYRMYSDWSKGKRLKEICIVYGTMYGNTEAGLNSVIEGIKDEGLAFSIHKVPNEDPSFIISDIYKSEGLVFAMPTYEYRMFPPMRYVLDLMGRKHINGRTVLRIGSWGWVGGAKKEFDDIAASLKLNCIESVEWPGVATEEVHKKLREAGRLLAKKVKAV